MLPLQLWPIGLSPSALISFPFLQLGREESGDLESGRSQDGRKLSPRWSWRKLRN